jgi:hypothetical protein
MWANTAPRVAVFAVFTEMQIHPESVDENKIAKVLNSLIAT